MSQILFYYTHILKSINDKTLLTKAQEQLAPWLREKNVLKTVQECFMHFTRILF